MLSDKIEGKTRMAINSECFSHGSAEPADNSHCYAVRLGNQDGTLGFQLSAVDTRSLNGGDFYIKLRNFIFRKLLHATNCELSIASRLEYHQIVDR
ncbi:hypothetical protein RRG08_019904 [Elysia crispata]|uniref:Uncharacterized protein n=1 Tax=Elysia crispata TaxID=231223 RepID=A0AAE1D3Q9_9GAST|nr:hypothetical protein RRG08_019904 [Elysia crispata]